jgi:DSF synthase
MPTMPQVVDLASDAPPMPVSRPLSGAALAGLVLGAADPVQAVIEAQCFNEFELEHDPEERALFCYFNFADRPCFSNPVLREAKEVQRLVRSFFGEGEAPLRYLVLGSRMKGVWNLGGDLELISTLIRKGDRAALRRYALDCCDVSYTNATGLGFDLPLISVALVQGDALGGGFEAALSANLIVAERGARFGLPEILFNLFPGMGAYSFLARRVSPGLAERIIMSGEMYSAEQLHAMGAVDVLAPDGQGRAAFYDFIGRGGRRYAALRALYRARRLVGGVTMEELTRVADLWVEAALRLDESGLRRMLRLLEAQSRRSAGRPT